MLSVNKITNRIILNQLMMYLLRFFKVMFDSRYAGVAVPQVLQYLREFDAPPMHREQTLTRKPCHCGSIKGGWCMELPIFLDQLLHGNIVCAYLDMFLRVWDLYMLPERKPQVTCKWQRHFNTFCWQLTWNIQLQRNTIPVRPSPGLPRTALLDLIF